MIGKSLLVAATVLSFAGAANADERRQHGTHEHGHGTLNIAIEGQSVHMELEVPGADIVGFEHDAVSDEDKARVEAARKVLTTANALFSLPAGAGCTLAKAKAGEHGASQGKHDDHSEFHVEYVFNCKAVESLGAIEFPYFDAFPNAEELDVTLVTGKGQKAFEVNRAQKRIDLQGMM